MNPDTPSISFYIARKKKTTTLYHRLLQSLKYYFWYLQLLVIKTKKNQNNQRPDVTSAAIALTKTGYSGGSFDFLKNLRKALRLCQPSFTFENHQNVTILYIFQEKEWAPPHQNRLGQPPALCPDANIPKSPPQLPGPHHHQAQQHKLPPKNQTSRSHSKLNRKLHLSQRNKLPQQNQRVRIPPQQPRKKYS